MKILYVGSTRRQALSLHYFSNFVRLGFKTIPFDPDYFMARTLWERAQVKWRKAPTQTRIDAISAELTRLCSRNQFDVVFVMAENFLGPDILQSIRTRSKKPPCLVYHSHDNNFSSGILKPAHFSRTISSYDLVFTTKSDSIAKYQAWGQPQSHFIASAFEPAVHHPIPADYSHFAENPFPVSFVGTYDQSRLRYLDTIGWEKIQVFGDFWKRYRKYAQHRDRIHPYAVYDFEFADITSHSRIALGLLREEAGDRHTTRTFEIPACRGFQIAPRNPEIQSYFKEDEEIVLFSSPDELQEKTNYYLRQDWQRERIAQRGYERVMRDHHTYLDRIKEIFSRIEEKTERKIFYTGKKTPALDGETLPASESSFSLR